MKCQNTENYTTKKTDAEELLNLYLLKATPEQKEKAYIAASSFLAGAQSTKKPA